MSQHAFSTCISPTLFSRNFYRPQTKLQKGNVFAPVGQSFCSQGRSAPVHAGIHPPGRHPRGRHSPGQTSPLGRHPPADGYCCGWHASYWNAFLLALGQILNIFQLNGVPILIQSFSLFVTTN